MPDKTTASYIKVYAGVDEVCLSFFVAKDQNHKHYHIICCYFKVLEAAGVAWRQGFIVMMDFEVITGFFLIYDINKCWYEESLEGPPP